ncbi:sushi domain-containing protein 1 isoform X1 [Crotalus tigris]|uniref:sushi domain-containing protein 1 isoform X1 n=1 Tax=Crotalus tigris TaxID=88082 RepID=UPI00192F7B6D|nr:sushi domain-containing protein 1 isoform X1 [Crotalus tigris]
MNSWPVGARQGRPRPDSLLLVLWALLLLTRYSAEEKKRENTRDVIFDVCATCHANATCVQKDGKDICECNYGFIGNGRTICHDKNECLSGICGEHAVCHNTHGSYYCVCHVGFQASNKHGTFIPNDGTTCIVVDCGPPPYIPNALSAPVDRTTYGNQALYTCQPNYVLESGNSTAVCNAKGKWEGADMVCKEIDCGKPPRLPNADIIWDNSTTLGSTIYYKCKDGFQSFGEHNFSECKISHKWENITFECKEITCGQPPVLSFSNMIWDGSTHPGSTVKYNCVKGFYSTGTKSHSVCTRNGSWEMLDLSCKKVQDFVNVTWKDPCVSWKRHYGSAGVNETYQVTVLMLGNESKEMTDMLIKPPATELAVNVCLQLQQHTNYTVEIIADSINLLLRLRIAHPVIHPVAEKTVFNNISIFNDTCIKWQRVPRRTQTEETYLIHLVGLRWYQEEFSHKMILNFTTNSWNPELCLNLSSGSNYTVNISTADLNHNVPLHLSIPLADPPLPQVEFRSAQGFIPLLSFLKAEGRNGPISSYQVIVIPGIPLCNFNCNSLTNLSYFSKGSESDSYVTAEFLAKSIPENRLSFVPGDRLYYGGFYNAPLKPSKAYCIVLKTVSKWNRMRTQSCVIWAHIRDISFPIQHLDIVILSSVAAISTIFLLLLCLACSTFNSS